MTYIIILCMYVAQDPSGCTAPRRVRESEVSVRERMTTAGFRDADKTNVFPRKGYLFL